MIFLSSVLLLRRRLRQFFDPVFEQGHPRLCRIEESQPHAFAGPPAIDGTRGFGLGKASACYGAFGS
jgi:hypothetical protein